MLLLMLLVSTGSSDQQTGSDHQSTRSTRRRELEEAHWMDSLLRRREPEYGSVISTVTTKRA